MASGVVLILLTQAAFIGVLIDLKIIAYSTAKEMDTYFSNRYGSEKMGDQLKPNKLKTNSKKADITVLNLLGYLHRNFLPFNPSP